MRALCSFLACLYATPATTSDIVLEWWMPYEFGRCTKTDIQEFSGCGKLEVSKKPKWR